MRVDDLRKTFEAAIGNLTPTKAQEMAKGLLDPGTAKDQVSRTATDLLEWSHKNRERLQSFIRKEIQDQLRQMGVATHKDVEALQKRVRDLERASAASAGRKRAPTPRATSSATSPSTPASTPASHSASTPSASKRASARRTPRAQGSDPEASG
jgi:polyhydroxyalkanoate synthesis regulator phasin